MDIDVGYMYKGINLGASITGGLVRILVGLLLFAIVFYAFMFVLKIRVLQDTVDLSNSNLAKLVITVNLIASLLGTVLAFVLILL
jgi:hypothetical protein